MAQVESLTKNTVHLSSVQVQNIDKNAIHDSNSNDLKGDSDINSDIELAIEESDDKETTSDNEDAVNKRSNEKKLDDLNANKDAESLKSLDADLTDTADLVRTGFSADEFSDQIDCLDAIDDSSVNTDNVNISNSMLKLNDLNDSEGSFETTLVHNDDTFEKNVDDTLTKSRNCSDEKSSSDTPENGVEGNNDKGIDAPVRAELLVSSTPLSESTVNNVGSEISQQSALNEEESKSKTPETNCSVAQQLISSDTDSLRTVETISVQVEEIPAQSTNDCSKQFEEMSVDADSSSEAIPIVNSDRSDGCNTTVAETEVPTKENESKPDEKMSVDSDSTSEAISISSTVDAEKNTANQLINDSKQTEEMSVDSNSYSEVISTDKSNENCCNVEKITESDVSKLVKEIVVDSNSPSKVPVDKNVDLSEENRTNELVQKDTEDDKSLPSSSKRNSSEKSETLKYPVNNINSNEDLSTNHIQNTQINDPVSQIHSPMVISDDKEPSSVDSNDIIIDSVESEIVELDAEEEPVILDDDIDEKLVSQSSQNKFNQLFATTAKEIAQDDVGADVVVGDEDHGVSSTDIEIFNSLMSNDNESRKRRLPQTESSLNDADAVEKRARISGPETSDGCNENESPILHQLFRKKPLVNKARKHTSSTNAADTVKEIEKRIHNDLRRQNRSQTSSPGQDSIDEFDFEINDNGVDVIDETGDEATQQPDNNSHKINLNYDVISKDNLKNIFKLMKTKLTRRQLEEIVIQKCCEMISDSNEIGALRRQVADLQQAEMFRKQKILNLEKQISQLRAVCQRFLEQVKENSTRQVTPIKITRSVGLQVSRESSSYNFEPTVTAQRSQEKLKKLLSAPVSNKRAEVEPETHQSVSRQRIASPLPSTVNHRNNDPRLMNGSAKINSPLNNSSSAMTSNSSSTVGNSRSNKKITPATDSSAPVIDLTDKDDKNENEGNMAAKNLLSTVNGAYVYVPVNKNQDQNRQVMKPGTSILVNGQLLTIQGTVQNSSKYSQLNMPHPAPVPPLPTPTIVPGAKPLPPKPLLKIDKSKAGIMLSWEFPSHTVCAEISKYQLYAYQETNLPARTDLWKAIGDVSALPLPMACTLTQFVEGYKYHFIVRAVDVHNRYGPFSVPRTITL